MLGALEQRSNDGSADPASAAPAAKRCEGFAGGDTYELFLRDVMLQCRVGIYPSEKGDPQRIRIGLSLLVRRSATAFDDDIGHVVLYEDILTGIRRIASAQHVALLETLGGRIVEFCLRDRRVLRVRLTIEKLDIFGGTAVPGIRMEGRQRNRARTVPPGPC